MTLVFSAIAAGGLVGAANQYACLLVVGLAAKFGLIQLATPMQFIGEWWFLGIVAALWVITIAPSFSHYLAPGIMHVINALVHFLSGFVVPVSSALIALAAAGVIANLDPQLRAVLDTLRVFGEDGALGPAGLTIAAGGAASAVALTGVKALAKPMLSMATGTVGHASAPMFAIAENVAAVVLMTLAYLLTQIDPRWLIGLFGVIALLTLGLFMFGLYQLWRLKKGLGRLLYIAQVHPRAGLSIAVEFFVWGLGWLVWGRYARGALSLLAWLVWLAALIALQPVVTVLFAIAPPLIPFALITANFMLIAVFFFAGLGSARALMQTLEKEVGLPDVPKRGAVAA